MLHLVRRFIVFSPFYLGTDAVTSPSNRINIAAFCSGVQKRQSGSSLIHGTGPDGWLLPLILSVINTINGLFALPIQILYLGDRLILT